VSQAAEIPAGLTLSRRERAINLAGIIIPFGALAVAVVTLWNEAVGPRELALLAGGMVICGLGVTVGYHRMLTHRSFEAHPAVRKTLTVLGAAAIEGEPVAWVTTHRRHHSLSDREGDPHSPQGHGVGIRGALKGLYHAHFGWLLSGENRGAKERYARDLLEDPFMDKVARRYLLIVAASFAVPALLGYLLGGTLKAALLGALWGGLLRVFVVHHVTYSINSICHFFGRRRFRTTDESRNVFWLALPTLGESWHNNHHAFPRSAVHGLGHYELDPSAWLILALERLGLVWNVVRPSAEQQARRRIS
jgi:stearoyl-CoA desaturase (delta-9 desaturase)